MSFVNVTVRGYKGVLRGRVSLVTWPHVLHSNVVCVCVLPLTTLITFAPHPLQWPAPGDRVVIHTLLAVSPNTSEMRTFEVQKSHCRIASLVHMSPHAISPACLVFVLIIALLWGLYETFTDSVLISQLTWSR